jgi:hypothetical protein
LQNTTAASRRSSAQGAIDMPLSNTMPLHVPATQAYTHTPPGLVVFRHVFGNLGHPSPCDSTRKVPF